ncbi:polysaccharide deacetylase family protein [Salmonella enterica]|nr:polysaccharide deacetylase family protein [Salmonella enterica]EEO6002342.1 polysaccharide deacetylase family protein [Salmonella enterica]
MYHHVSQRKGLITISIDTFREQMRWLAKNGWKTVTTDEMELFYQGGELPRKSVMLTFDDGYLDNWFNVFPVLKEFNLNAHIFLITGLIGDGPARYFCADKYSHHDCEMQIAMGNADSVMLRWQEVREMYDSGLVEFHPHTHTHTRWDKKEFTPELTKILLRSDIILSRECMKEKMGRCSQHLCWPEGHYNQEYMKIAQELGFNFLYTTERRVNCIKNGTIQLGRISTKEREHSGWLKRRLFCYTMPFFSSLLSLHKGPRLPNT